MAYDFPASPILNQTFNNYVWDGEKWKLQSPPVTGAVRYDIAQSLNSTQRSQARANIDVTKKNYIINGAMMVSQENGSTALTASGGWVVDQYVVFWTTAAVFTYAQVASPTPAGSPNRIRITTTTGPGSVGASDYLMVQYRLEGLRVADLRSGSAAAKTVTIQFGCKGPAGTYSVVLQNGAQNRCYPMSFTISAGEANIDVVKSVTIPLDTAGTWPSDNTFAMCIVFSLYCGTTFQAPAGAWAAGTFWGAPGSTDGMRFNGAIFELFDVSLTEGTVAPPFMVPDYASELQACRRYWYKITISTLGYNAGGGQAGQGFMHPQIMRSTPTENHGFAGASFSNSSSPVFDRIDAAYFRFLFTVMSTGMGFVDNQTVTFSARL